MRFSENRVIAWIVLAACVLGSIVGLGGAGMARERGKIMEVFYEGAADRDSAHCMAAYLERAAECAQVMAGEAEIYLGQSSDSLRMLELADLIGDDGSLDSRAAAYRELCSLSDRLYNAMYAAKLPDADRVNFKTAYDDFWGADKFIRKDPYREMADDYNDSIDSFPANLVTGIWGAGELNDFDA